MGNDDVRIAATMAGRPAAEVREILDITNPDLLTDVFLVHRTPNWRGALQSFGSCSITEPVASLFDLHLLPSGILEAGPKADAP